MIILEDKSTAEIWSLKTGTLINSFQLHQNSTKELFADAIFTGISEEGNPSFVLLSNSRLTYYKDYEIRKEIIAEYYISLF